MLNIVRIRCPVKWIRCPVVRCRVKVDPVPGQVVRISSRPAPGGTIDSAVRARTLTVSCEYWTGSVRLTTLAPGGPVVSRIGLGLAALGRPAYITGGREDDLPDRSVDGLRARTFSMLDAAYDSGIMYFDAARSYGKAEEFLGGWLAARGYADAVCGSKWGYRYTGGWQLNADRQEVKEHTLAMFTTQLAQTRAALGDRLALYQVHSLTPESGLLDDRALLTALARLRAEGVIIGLTTSGPGQADALRRALPTTVDGRPLFTVAQVTWNLLEPSVAPAAAEAAAAGWTILIKEALANGRLASGTGLAGASGTGLAGASGTGLAGASG